MGLLADLLMQSFIFMPNSVQTPYAPLSLAPYKLRAGRKNKCPGDGNQRRIFENSHQHLSEGILTNQLFVPSSTPGYHACSPK